MFNDIVPRSVAKRPIGPNDSYVALLFNSLKFTPFAHCPDGIPGKQPGQVTCPRLAFTGKPAKVSPLVTRFVAESRGSLYQLSPSSKPRDHLSQSEGRKVTQGTNYKIFEKTKDQKDESSYSHDEEILHRTISCTKNTLLLC